MNSHIARAKNAFILAVFCLAALASCDSCKPEKEKFRTEKEKLEQGEESLMEKIKQSLTATGWEHIERYIREIKNDKDRLDAEIKICDESLEKFNKPVPEQYKDALQEEVQAAERDVQFKSNATLEQKIAVLKQYFADRRELFRHIKKQTELKK
jgi:septal ring factor EnvC (AmiA/AmiB activator)